MSGGAGFIGSHLVEQLLREGNNVRVFDNFSTGYKRNLALEKVQIFEGDLRTDTSLVREALDGVETVYHLAANADVRDGWSHPRLDFEQNVEGTLSLAEHSAAAGVENFVFTSTGSVYGESYETFSENSPFPIQTSLYGASKLAAEGFLQAYAEAEKFQVTIFRLVSVLGSRYSHGHVVDFYRQLQRNSKVLRILGDGQQTKSYLHVYDCVRGLTGLRGANRCEVFNLGTDETMTVETSAQWIVNELGLSPKFEFSGGAHGWLGDNPWIALDIRKAISHGWKPKHSIREAVVETVRWLRSGESS